MFRPPQPSSRARRRGRSARLFDKQSELHQGARLVHMGGDGKICLVESMFHNGGKVQVRALSLMTLKHHFQSLFAGF
jgi:hypothetical protein